MGLVHSLQESHHNMVQYELPSEDLSLSRVFAKMEEASHDLEIEDYSVSQNTLDNVSGLDGRNGILAP